MRPRIRLDRRDDAERLRVSAAAADAVLVEPLETRQLLSRPPRAPSNLTVAADGGSPTVRLTWTDNSDNETGFTVQRRRGRSGAWLPVATLPANTTAFRNANLAVGTAYAYRVAAYSRRGGSSAFTAPASAATSAVGAPQLDVGWGAFAGDAIRKGRQTANRIALSPDGSLVYALTQYGSDSAAGQHPMIDVLHTSDPAAAGGLGDGRFDLNAVLPTAISVASGLAVQPDGKLIVAGNTASDTSGDIAVARFNPDGSLDASFNAGAGELTVNFGNQEYAADVAVAPDGSIYLGGTDQVYQSTDEQFFAIRLTAGGTVDLSYGINGISKGFDSPTPLGARAIAIDPTDGSVVIVGETYHSLGQWTPPITGIAGTRLLPDGTAADGFQFGGTVSVTGSYADDVIVQPDHKIVFVGTTKGVATAVRLNADGTADSTWTDASPVIAAGEPDDAELHGIVRLPDGSYVVVGDRTQNGTWATDAIVAHLSTDGKIVNAIVDHHTGSAYETAAYQDVALSPDGSLFAAGDSQGTLLLSKYRVL